MDKELLHCINMNAYRDETYLISVQQFMERFFPNVSIYPTAVSVLKDCGVGTYLPNQYVSILHFCCFNLKDN